MNHTPTAFLLAVSLSLGAMPASAAFKCWTNAEGVRECGNAVPPEYAQQETRTINQQGVTTGTQQRALTGEELAAEQRRQAEEAARVAEEKRRREERANADRVLLSTFASEDDIVMARDRKITALNDSIELTNVSVGKLNEKLDVLRKRAANIERSGKPVPDELKEDIGALQKQIDNKQAFAASKRVEIEELRVKYDQDLARFRELMSQRGR